jgi:uncharacterized repeat protein (TIGR03803 family)
MWRNGSLPSSAALLVSLSLALVVTPYAAAGGQYKILHSFGNGADGAGVFAGLALDPKGNLYGATTGGGTYAHGTLFRLTPGLEGRWAESILHNFCRLPRCGGDGASPWDTPVLDSKGSLYDESNAGIFQMTHGLHGWSFKVIDGNSDAEATLPPKNEPGINDLLLDSAGNLYGGFGVGKNYNGAVGELSSGTHGWKEKDLYDFCLHPRNGQCLDGSYPAYRLTWDAAGNLYGVTIQGGANKWGVAYELQHTASGWQEHVLYDFPSNTPGSSLTFDSAGNLYGTTFQEGPCDGTVYQLSPQGKSRWKRTILYHFCNPEQSGGAPDEPVTFDPRTGVLYGTASAGGDPVCQCGVIFKLTPNANGKWQYRVLYKFHGPDGAGPNGLTIDSKGNLYGTTVAGGKYGYGTAFQFVP